MLDVMQLYHDMSKKTRERQPSAVSPLRLSASAMELARSVRTT